MNELERMAPELRLINLETTVTKSSDYWIGLETLENEDHTLTLQWD